MSSARAPDPFRTPAPPSSWDLGAGDPGARLLSGTSSPRIGRARQARKIWCIDGLTTSCKSVTLRVFFSAAQGEARCVSVGIIMAECSFDVVSSVDLQEVKNAIAQAMKEIGTRFDLKGTGSSIELSADKLVLTSSDEFKLKAVRDVLEGRLVKRSVPLKALSYGKIEEALGGTVRQAVELQKGIPTEKAREVVKLVKETKLKVQAAIQGDQVRISGKNRDDLQSVIRKLRETDLGIDMQFTNYR